MDDDYNINKRHAFLEIDLPKKKKAMKKEIMNYSTYIHTEKSKRAL